MNEQPKKHLTEKEKEISNNIRSSTMELLLLYSSAEQQREYANQVGDQTAITEMVCMWFDDLYDINSVIFRYAFAHFELLKLEDFNKFFDEVDELIPEDSIDELLDDSNWKILMEKASVLHLELTKWNKGTPHKK
ncbi:hypothetical protein V6R21_23465 [Limibacter armeniacum]|uniref:hypothetical protein n=1 Tax=Limibacter armeniacum TaxID=466084 RepID=UPI002FE5FB07